MLNKVSNVVQRAEIIYAIREKAHDWYSFGLALHLLQIGAKTPILIQTITKQLQIQWADVPIFTSGQQVKADMPSPAPLAAVFYQYRHSVPFLYYKDTALASRHNVPHL